MLVLLALVLIFQESSGQLFPFSTLRHYIDQKHAESAAEESSTNTPPPVDNFRYLHETSKLNPVKFSPTLVKEFRTIDKDRTVVVTPRSKYSPQRLIPEPDVEPNDSEVPSIGYKLNNELKEAVSVETVPALSVQLPQISNNLGLIDYLVPPKYPSVYETMEISTTKTPKLLVATKAKKKKNKRREKNEAIEKINDNRQRLVVKEPENSPSEKRFRSPKESEKNVEWQRPGPEKNNEKRVRSRPRPLPTKYKPSTPDTHSSATNDFYDAPVSQFNSELPENIGLNPSNGERIEFQLHGQSGPESYKFGFDTGDGKNRHFRYEEKDNNGNVKGHYGYYDRTGKLQVVNYHADKHGFHANPSS